jgi:hypothetical protein
MMSAVDIEEDMTDAGKTSGPKMVKGGVFAPADVKLIKRALQNYLDLDIEDSEVKQIVNLLHRLNRVA